jgi:hypothetical protein
LSAVIILTHIIGITLEPVNGYLVGVSETEVGLRDPFGNPIRILQQGKAKGN